MDKPQVDRIEGIPPAIAIDQTNPVRTSRSTVGTMTELNDHLKLLFARAAQLYCRGCGQPVRRDTPAVDRRTTLRRARCGGRRPRACWSPFRCAVPENFTEAEVRTLLEQQGYTRIHARRPATARSDPGPAAPVARVDARPRVVRSTGSRAAAWVAGGWRCMPLDDDRRCRRALARSPRTCTAPTATSTTSEPMPSLFSFNSPLGACETCRGFGRIIGIDYDLVIPDGPRRCATARSSPGRPRPTRNARTTWCGSRASAACRSTCRGADSRAEHRRWVIEGEGDWDDERLVRRATLLRLAGEQELQDAHPRAALQVPRYTPARPARRTAQARGAAVAARSRRAAESAAADGSPAADCPRLRPAGLTSRLLPIARLREFFAACTLPAPLDEATDLLLGEIRARLGYLVRGRPRLPHPRPPVAHPVAAARCSAST